MKVCAIASIEDIEVCVWAGVDALGFSLARGLGEGRPGYLGVSEAVELIQALPFGVASILLVHTGDYGEIARACDLIRPDYIQIRRSVQPKALLRVRENVRGLGVLKTIGVSENACEQSLIDMLMPYLEADAIDAVLLDSPKGGSGEVHDWSLSRQVREALPDVPLILAGGLNPRNVTKALAAVKPNCVDVLSGVRCNGLLDSGRLRDFVEQAKNWRGEAAVL